MIKTKTIVRNIVLAGAFTLLPAASAFAQYGYGSYPVATQGFANRVVEGTVASAEPARNGERIRLTNGMDLFVPNSVISTNQGRSYQTSLLQPGDVVRMGVYSREGDGRDARVRSVELLRSGGDYNNARSLSGTVVSFDRRNNMLVLQTDRGRTVNVEVGSYNGRLRRGDRVNVSGRMDRDRGNFIAVGVTFGNR